MENYQMFISSMPTLHDLNGSYTSFGNGGCSNTTVPTIMSQIPDNNNDRHHHHQEQLLATASNHSRSCLDGSEKKKKKGVKKVRNPRFAFETRTQVDVLDDGYRWRKYGQKAVKNNKFPRSYYRCTHQGCNVKKQVQRLTGDEEVVVTTYEGTHTHPVEKTTENFENILSQMHILPIHLN